MEVSGTGTGIVAVFGVLNLSTLMALGTLIFRSGRHIEKLEMLSKTVETSTRTSEDSARMLVQHGEKLRTLEERIEEIDGQKSEVVLAKLVAHMEALERHLAIVHKSVHDVKNVIMVPEFATRLRMMQQGEDIGG